MRGIKTAALAIVLVVLAVASAHATRGDVRIGANGVESSGARMQLACELDFVSVPSNVFAGACRISVGGDELVLAGSDPDRQRGPTALLNGRLTIRGFADSATGRFAPLVERGALGFPVFLEIDPLGRAWSIRADAPGGTSETVTSGAITGGRIFFVLP